MSAGEGWVGITVLWYQKTVSYKILLQLLYMSYNESLYNQIIQNQVDLNPFLARKGVGHWKLYGCSFIHSSCNIIYYYPLTARFFSNHEDSTSPNRNKHQATWWAWSQRAVEGRAAGYCADLGNYPTRQFSFNVGAGKGHGMIDNFSCLWWKMLRYKQCSKNRRDLILKLRFHF